MILKGLSDYNDWTVNIGQHLSEPETSGYCYECKCFGYFYVYKDRKDFVEGTNYSYVLFNGEQIRHCDLYKIITRVKKLERIIC